jgi:hypothetical protein
MCDGIAGKIDLGGAEAQALDAGGVSLVSNTSSSSTSSADGNANSENQTSNYPESKEGGYDINLFARGNVRVETMSWIQVIRSKYGFKDDGGAPIPSGVGRTASASLLAADIAKLDLRDVDKVER